MENFTKIKLNLACGDLYADGYINIDNKSQYDGTFKVDMEADILLLDWDENSVDEILLSHFLMYIPYDDVPKILTKWYGWLKEGGLLVMEQGNVKVVAQKIIESNDPEIINGKDGVRQLYGFETTVGHKWAWCPETIVPILKKIGFKDIRIGDGVIHNNPTRDFVVEAIK